MNQNPLVRLIRTVFTQRTPAVIAGLLLFVALLVVEGVGITRWIHNSTATALTAFNFTVVEKEPPGSQDTVPAELIVVDDSGLKRHTPMTDITALHQWHIFEEGEVAQTRKEKLGYMIESSVSSEELLSTDTDSNVVLDGIGLPAPDNTSPPEVIFNDDMDIDDSNSTGATQPATPPTSAQEVPVVPTSAPPPPAVQQPVATATTVPLPTAIPTQAPPPPPVPTEPPPPPPPPTEVPPPPPPPPVPTEAPPPPPPPDDDNGDDDDNDDDDEDDDNDDDDDDGDDEDDD